MNTQSRSSQTLWPTDEPMATDIKGARSTALISMPYGLDKQPNYFLANANKPLII